MKKVEPSELPQAFEITETVWIEMPDGKSLAGRLWLPAGARRSAVPGLMEMMPYRRRDFSRRRDDELHGWFAGHGYAVLRVDTRGTGDSEGLLMDEYLPLEQEDAVAVLAWMRSQDWCDGNLGMMGLSWSGFLSLQTATHKPEGLKAVLAVGVTDDRFDGDVHYKGGQMIVENPAWDATFLALSSLPPDARVVGDNWKEIWLERLETREPWIGTWADHQIFDDYWRQGSVAPDYGRIECPVYVMGGTSDGYIDPVFRLFENLSGPTKALIGPWPHVMPNEGYPGPGIGFLQEALRWWDYWLKGDANGIMEGPRANVFVKEYETPSRFVADYEGGWVGIEAWPPQDLAELRFGLGEGRLLEGEGEPKEVFLSTTLLVGQNAGKWGAGGGPTDLAEDQREDDEGSLCFDSTALEGDVILIGQPRFDVDLSCDKPHGQIVARLMDFAPDGSSLLISWGILNVSGNETAVSLMMKGLAHKVPAGHRLRLGLSTSYWPVVWPSPEVFSLRLEMGSAVLTLPKWNGTEPSLSPFEEPLKISATGNQGRRQGALDYSSQVDDDGNWMIRQLSDYGGQFIEGIGVETDLWREEKLSLSERKPHSARYVSEARHRYVQDDNEIGISTHYEFGASKEAFRYDVALTITLGGEEFFKRDWQGRVLRREG